MTNITLLVDQYANGEMERDNLQQILEDMGLSSEIVALHMLGADYKKGRVRQRHEKGYKLTVSSTVSIPTPAKGNRDTGPLPAFKTKGV